MSFPATPFTRRRRYYCRSKFRLTSCNLTSVNVASISRNTLSWIFKSFASHFVNVFTFVSLSWLSWYAKDSNLTSSLHCQGTSSFSCGPQHTSHRFNRIPSTENRFQLQIRKILFVVLHITSFIFHASLCPSSVSLWSLQVVSHVHRLLLRNCPRSRRHDFPELLILLLTLRQYLSASTRNSSITISRLWGHSLEKSSSFAFVLPVSESATI